MPLNIGNKVFRNLQEQVGYNSERIEKIKEFLDGLNVQDNVVVVPDMSYILSDEELEIIKREVAFIVYNGSLYLKKSMDSSEAKFDIVFTISGTTAITFSTSEIAVTLANGALGITNATYYAYSTTQIDNKLADKSDITYIDAQLALCAKLAGADFTGDVKAPLLLEKMTGYTAAAGVNKYITFTYVSIVKTGNKITLAVAGLINLPTGQTISEYTNMGSVLFYCPASVMDKIYPAGASGAGFSNGLSAKNIQSFYDYSVKADINVVCRKGSSYFEVVFYGTSNTQTQIGAHVDENFAFRYEETFLLSDSLV